MSKPSRPAFQERVTYHATLLGAFATLATALLVLGNLTTAGPIAERQAEDMRASLSEVIPAQMHDNNLLQNTLRVPYQDHEITVYRATLEGHISGFAYQVLGYGYAGEMRIMMGVNAKGEILGVRVLAHAETPGLGDKIETAKADWIYSFNGLSLENTPSKAWAVKKDGGRFDQFSGATITPRGVVAAVKSGLEFFATKQAQLTAIHPEEEKTEKGGTGHE